MRRSILLLGMITLATLGAAPLKPQDDHWSCAAGGPSRNNVNPSAKNLPTTLKPDDPTVNLLWKATLGTRTVGQPVVAQGRVLIGTNNENPRKPNDFRNNADRDREPIRKGVLICFDAATGKFQWQATHDKLDGFKQDWASDGVSSTPYIDGDRVYYVNNRAELLCVDLKGPRAGINAVIHWKVDLIQEYGVSPTIHVCMSTTRSSPLIVGDAVYIITGNGVDETGLRLPKPDAPSFMAFNKNTGKLLWKDNSPGKNIMHGQWSSPAYTETPVPQVIFPGGDGWLRAFDPKTGKLLWKFDGNLKGVKYDIGGIGERNYFVAMPVIHDGKLVIGTGQHPEHFIGVGHLWCLDLTKAVQFGKTNVDADVSVVNNNLDPQAAVNQASALVWHYGGKVNDKYDVIPHHFGRTVSNVVIVGDVLYATDLTELHCLDFRTGKRYWTLETKAINLSTPSYADGRIYLAAETELLIFNHQEKPFTLDNREEIGKATSNKDARQRQRVMRKQVEEKLGVSRIEFDDGIHTSPTAV